MAFWGVEVKPGNRYTHVYDQTRGRLRITQAVLGSPLGSNSNSNSKPSSRTVVQCNYDKSSPVLICCLLPGSNESTHMELEFEEQNEVVFSVLGQRSVHLTGYFLGRKKFGEDSEETNGEDIADTESEGLGADEDDSYESDFIDDDDIIDDTPLLQSSEDDEPWKRRAAKRKKRKVIIESEDGEENEFLEDEQKGKEKKRKSDKQNGEDNKMNSDEQKGKDTKKKINEEKGRGVSKSKKIDKKGKVTNSVVESKENKMVECVGENKQPEKSTPEKNKKKKSKIGKKETEKVDTKQPKKIETFPSGLIIEEISTSSPEGQIANPGCKVYVNYVGKLQNGKTFDSNAGQKPFKFHLGKGQVIMGWDLGIKGMRVGEKRRLTIPPTLGYGDEEVENVPKNSWLDYEVEMVTVK